MQIDMGDDPQLGFPFGDGGHDFNQRRIVAGAAAVDEADAKPGAQGFVIRFGFGHAIDKTFVRHVVAQPAVERRAVVGVVGADEAVAGKIGGSGRVAMALDIALRGIKADLHLGQRLHDVVGLLRGGPGADRNMRLAIIQPEQAHVRYEADHDAGMGLLKGGEHRGQDFRDARDRGDDQLSGDGFALALDARHQLAKLFLGGLGDFEKFAAGFGRGIATGVALKQLGSEAFFQSVDVANDRGMVDTQHIGGTRNRAQPGDLIGRANLVPGIDDHVCAFLNRCLPI